MYNLENKIKEALPRLSKIEKGQRFLSKHYGVITATQIDDLGNGKYGIYGFDELEGLPRSNYYPRDLELIGHSIKLNDVLEYAKLKSNFKELFYYYCSADQSENNESEDTFESNFRDYKNIFKDLYYDDEEGYHPDYDGDILYKAIVRTEIYDDKGYYNHRFVIEPNDFILRNWDLSSVFLADQNEELINFLNTL